MPEAGPSDAEARALERVARLLALAESPNVNEAEAAMAAAQKLMLRYNLTSAASARTRSYAHRHLGTRAAGSAKAERILAMILGKHFFVECIWVSVYRPRVGKRGSVLEVCGTRENLDIAEYVHSYLLSTGERLWAQHKLAQGIRGDRDRRTFLAGVMAGFESKLSGQKKVHESEGLVWVGDRDLGEFYRHRNPHVRHVRYSGGRRTRPTDTDAIRGRASCCARGSERQRAHLARQAADQWRRLVKARLARRRSTPTRCSRPISGRWRSPGASAGSRG